MTTVTRIDVGFKHDVVLTTLAFSNGDIIETSEDVGICKVETNSVEEAVTLSLNTALFLEKMR